MTPDQRDTLTQRLTEIQSRLNTLRIPPADLDDYASNQIIAEARYSLHKLDSELFQCFHLMSHFYDTNHPITHTETPMRHTPTIDDLEI